MEYNLMQCYMVYAKLTHYYFPLENKKMYLEHDYNSLQYDRDNERALFVVEAASFFAQKKLMNQRNDEWTSWIPGCTPNFSPSWAKKVIS